MGAHRNSNREHFAFIGWPVVGGLIVLERMMQSYRTPLVWMEHARHDKAALPLVQKEHTASKYIWRVALPGVTAEQIQLSADHGAMTLNIGGKGKTGRQKKTQAVRRVFSLPVYTDGHAITAKLKNGILTISLPKTDKPVPA